MIKVQISTAGSQKIKNKIRQFVAEREPKKKVTIGIHEDAGAHKGGEISNALLGASLHFGTDIIPARPWLDTGAQTGITEYKKIIDEGIANGDHPDDILEKLGVIAVGKVQQYMQDLSSPENSPETIKRKGSSNPLVDTGQLIQSITYEVHGKNEPTN